MGDSGFEGLSKTRLDGIKEEFGRYREDGGTRSFWWFCQNCIHDDKNPELIRAAQEWINYGLDMPNHLPLMEWLTASEPSGPGGLIDGPLIRKVYDHVKSAYGDAVVINSIIDSDQTPCIAQARDQWKNYLQDRGSNISFQSYLDLSWDHFKETPASRQAAPASRESSDDDSQSLGFLETHDFTSEDEDHIVGLMDGLDAYRKAGGQLPFVDWLAGEQRATQADEPTTPVDPRVTPPLTKDGRPIWAEPGYDYVSLKMPMLRGSSNIEAMAPKPGAIEFTDLSRLVLQAFQILQKKRRRRLFGFIGLPSIAFIWTLIQIIVLIWRNWPESQATTSASTPDKFDQDVIDAVAEAIGKHVAEIR